MFNNWINNFSKPSQNADEHNHKDLQKASAQLLLEVARADFHINDEERAQVIEAISRTTAMTAEELNELVADAEQHANTSISYHEHIRLINDSFTREQKITLIEQLWQVAYADQNLDRYEEAFIRKIADLIYVKHRDFIQAKLRVQPPG
ncbi:MAG: TerB family tellurite resistance protein [Granulosicoccus sp.]|nr:TerB family tellurite resistance protein [Granulosicoccus sp.]